MSETLTHDEIRPDLVGDGYDDEVLLKARDVARRLGLSVNQVYELPIPRVRVGKRSIRWRPRAVDAFIETRTETL